MDNPENPIPSQPDLRGLQQQVESLQSLVSSLLLILIVISGTLAIFLLRQWRFAKAEVDALTPQATQLAIEYTNSYPVTQDVIRRLAEYGRTHPDFANIAAKYHLTDTLPKPGTTPLTSSLPAAATSKK